MLGERYPETVSCIAGYDKSVERIESVLLVDSFNTEFVVLLLILLHPPILESNFADPYVLLLA